MVTNPMKYVARWLLRYELQEFHMALAQARANEQYWKREYDKQMYFRNQDFISRRPQ